MKNKLYVFLAFIFVCFLIVLAFALWPTKTRSITADNIDLSSQELIDKGKYLASVGDCVACHTTRGGRDFAGGLALESPIGNMYSTNITPDKNTGIGNYTLNDFDRAVRHGIRADGVTLYPAMPFPSFSFTSDEDIVALYAYFMNGVKPVEQANKANDIMWPLSIRWPLAMWRKVYVPDAVVFNASAYPNDEIARGAYLVQGLGHCGACHTPRSITMQEKGLTEKDPAFLTGGQVIDGWYATSLRDGVDGLGLWTQEEIVATLKTGRNDRFTVVGSAMMDVVQFSTQHLSDDDLNAMAAYLKSLPATSTSGAITYTTQADDAVFELTAAMSSDSFLYRDNCAACHGLQGAGMKELFPVIAGNPTVISSDPTSLIRIILEGYDVPEFNAELLPMRMPGFGDSLSDEEIARLSSYIRNSWGNKAPNVTATDVKKVRQNPTVH